MIKMLISGKFGEF